MQRSKLIIDFKTEFKTFMKDTSCPTSKELRQTQALLPYCGTNARIK